MRGRAAGEAAPCEEAGSSSAETFEFKRRYTTVCCHFLAAIGDGQADNTTERLTGVT